MSLNCFMVWSVSLLFLKSLLCDPPTRATLCFTRRKERGLAVSAEREDLSLALKMFSHQNCYLLR